MYAFLCILIVLLIYSLQDKEAFTIHIEGGTDVITPIKNTVQMVASGIHENVKSVTRPVYSTLVGFIPYRHHYRRLRRQYS